MFNIFADVSYVCKNAGYDVPILKTIFLLVLGAPYLEYKFSPGAVNRTEHMVFETFTAQTLTIAFNTFASPEASVTIYKVQSNNDIYELNTNSRVTTTTSYVTISDTLLSDKGRYLITAANSFGQSINNLTFDVIVIGKASSASLLLHVLGIEAKFCKKCVMHFTTHTV